MLARLGEQSDDQAGVHPAGQQAADRHVGDQSSLHGSAQRIQDRILPVVFGPVGAIGTAGEIGSPVGGRGPGAVGLDGEQ